MSEATQASDQIATPAAFADTISPDKAPAGIRPVGETPTQGPHTLSAEEMLQRQQAVISKYDERAASLPTHIATQPTVGEATARVEEALRGVTQANDALRTAQDRMESPGSQSGLLGGLKSKFFKDSRESEQAAAEQSIADAVVGVERAQAEAEQAEKDKVSAERYTPEYLSKESDPDRIAELKAANEKGGPLTTSPEMTKALIEQDAMTKVLKEQAAFYREIGYDTTGEETKLLSPKQIDDVRRSLDKLQKQHSERRIIRSMSEALKTVAGSYSESLRYADEHNLPVNEDTLSMAIEQGERLLLEKDYGDASKFVTLHRSNRTPGAERAGIMEIGGLYGIGGAKLENLFSWQRVPDGEERVPYILAFIGGALAVDGNPSGLARSVRDWIAESLPVPSRERVRENGRFVEKEMPPKPRGLGYFCSVDATPFSVLIDKNGTGDKELAEAMTRANEIVKSFGKNMRDRRILAGNVLGDRDLQDPVYHEPNDS